MADKLDWLNKHFVLLRYLTVEDAAGKENYKIRPDLAPMFAGVSSAEEMVFKFAKSGQFKEACEFMAYIAHRRGGIWWGYRCINSLIEELKENPASERDIADIGKSFEVEVPDFAKVKAPEPDPAQVAQLQATIAQLEATQKKALSMVNPEIHKLFEDAMEVCFSEFKSVHGIHPMDMIKIFSERASKQDPYKIDENSPIFKAAAELKAKLQSVQKDTVDTIKSVIPPKVPEHQKMLQDNSMAAVYRWVAAPDAENSQKCLDIGNECPDTPAGLLSLSAFWAYGNLMPMGEQIVPTPPGLAANGLSQVLLFCALHKGGTRKLKERYEEYFRLGVDVLTGKDNWEESLAQGKMPHDEIPQAAETDMSAAPAVPLNTKDGGNDGDKSAPAYKRWKPSEGTE